jgi:hypothetical protein
MHRARYILFSLPLAVSACLEPAPDPRPLPALSADGSLFDARRPVQRPNTGSGYGSGVPGPTGASGPRETVGADAHELDAGDLEDGAFSDSFVDGGTR